MHLLKIAIIMVVALIVMLGLARKVNGDDAGYWVIRPTPSAHHVDPVAPRMQYGVHRQPYAYGWFGAQPSRHRSRSFGYYQDRTTWTFQ